MRGRQCGSCHSTETQSPSTRIVMSRIEDTRTHEACDHNDMHMLPLAIDISPMLEQRGAMPILTKW